MFPYAVFWLMTLFWAFGTIQISRNVWTCWRRKTTPVFDKTWEAIIYMMYPILLMGLGLGGMNDPIFTSPDWQLPIEYSERLGLSIAIANLFIFALQIRVNVVVIER